MDIQTTGIHTHTLRNELNTSENYMIFIYYINIMAIQTTGIHTHTHSQTSLIRAKNYMIYIHIYIYLHHH